MPWAEPPIPTDCVCYRFAFDRFSGMLWSSPAITDESTNPDGWLQPVIRPGHSPTGGPGRTSHWLACDHNGSTTRLRDAGGGCQGIEPWNALRGTSPSRPTPTDCVCDRLSQRINTGYRVCQTCNPRFKPCPSGCIIAHQDCCTLRKATHRPTGGS